MATIFGEMSDRARILAGMPKLARRPKELTGKMFRGGSALQKGLLTRAELRSSAWRQLFRDVYSDCSLPVTHRRKCLAASYYVIPSGAAIAGRSAAHLLGVELVADAEPVEVITPQPFGPVKGLTIHLSPLMSEDIRRTGMMVTTTPVRICWDLARWLDLPETVVFLDALLARRVVNAAQLVAYANARLGLPGASRLLAATRLADPAAESPQESRLRVRLVLAGLPQPQSQFVVTSQGLFVARVDLAWPDLKIALEYDGAWHADHRQLERDRARLNQLVGAGWLVLHVTAQRMRDDFDGVMREVRAAIRNRRGARVSV